MAGGSHAFCRFQRRSGTLYLGLRREPLAGLVLGQEYPGRAIRLAEIDEAFGQVGRRLVGSDEGERAARLEAARIGTYTRAPSIMTS